MGRRGGPPYRSRCARRCTLSTGPCLSYPIPDGSGLTQKWAGNVDSFLALLNETARPSDFVAIKVDIEGQAGGPELPIVRAIAEQPELNRLVDEIFFEYHYYFDGIDFGWGANKKAMKEGNNVDAALALMHKLRLAGIRSHFWI
jgi:hypothetical protein